MRHIPLVRATHLNVYLSVLRDLGAPVDRALQRAKLPGSVEETPDAYLCVPHVLDFVSDLGGSEAAMELGFIAAKRSTLESLRPELQGAIHQAPSCFARLQALIRYAPKEDGALVNAIVDEGTSVRIVSDLYSYDRSPALAYAEWLQLQAIVSVVRSVAGPTWTPAEMTFVSSRELPADAREEYANTHILMAQPHTSVVVSRALLGLPCASDPHTINTDGVNGGLGLADMIREIVKPYLRDSPLLAAELAEMLGVSERTLQRKLGNQNLSYARLVGEARYQVACELLPRQDMRIMDVAFAAGYENPSHFTRAFRRVSGVSPREFRNPPGSLI